MHCTSPGQNIQKQVLSGNFFLASLTLSGKLSAFALTFPKQAVNEGLCACPKICDKGKKWEIYGFLGGFWLDVFCISAKIVEAVISKMLSTYPEKNFRGICVQKTLVFDY